MDTTILRTKDRDADSSKRAASRIHEDLCRELRSLRHQQGVTLRELAGRLGTSAGRLASLENGRLRSFDRLIQGFFALGASRLDLARLIAYPRYDFEISPPVADSQPLS